MVKKIILEAREMKRCAYVNAVLLDGTETMEPKTGLVLSTEGVIRIVIAISRAAFCRIFSGGFRTSLASAEDF